MMEKPRLGVPGLVLCLLIVLVAGAVRGRYLTNNLDASAPSVPLEVQDPPRRLPETAANAQRLRTEPNELDRLVHNLKENHGFVAPAPFSDEEERTAHVAPGYPWLLARLAGWIEETPALLRTIRWSQCVLGALTAGLYFLFTWGAFRNWYVATLAGLFCAVHPFWVFNTPEVNDGVVVTFLLALVLVLGMRGSEEGGAFVSLLFGLSLAGLAMVRAALLPFAVVACLWFLLSCRRLPRGWLCSVLAVLGFANGLAPWMVRNAQAFGDIIPVTDSMYLHLWIGNNKVYSAGPQDEQQMREAVSPELRRQLLAEPNQARRYAMLGKYRREAERDSRPVELLWETIETDPGPAILRRLSAGLYFVFGEAWFQGGQPFFRADFQTALREYSLALLSGSMLAMLVLGVLGWRWTYGWRRQTRLATLALIWIPLPYLLSHAELLTGPRLPLDGVLLCCSAFALCCLVPGVRNQLVVSESSATP